MKTNNQNQTEQALFELAVTKAANDDGASAAELREAISAARKQVWSPFEVWRTRVKAPVQLNRSKSAPI